MCVWLPVHRVCLDSLIAGTLLKSIVVALPEEPDNYGMMSPTPHGRLHECVIYIIGFLVCFKRRADCP